MKFLDFLAKHGRKRVILDRVGESPYLERYYIFLKDREAFPFNIFLHHFLRSDPDDLHDHPWPYATLIVKGGYWEWVPLYHPQEPGRLVGEKRVWRGAGHFRTCNAESYHRIELEPTVDCWTIFMPGIKQRDWGFLTHKEWNSKTFKWIQWQAYIDSKRKEKS